MLVKINSNINFQLKIKNTKPISTYLSINATELLNNCVNVNILLCANPDYYSPNFKIYVRSKLQNYKPET